jgi:hypothetical protein
MAGLYVALDVNYADDDKVIAAGPMAELLFVRSLAFAKRDRHDGRITDGQVRDVISARIPRHRLAVDRLVDVGLWERNGSGFYVSAWLKRNLPVVELDGKKAAAGVLGNHTRWHLGPDAHPSPECSHCVKEGLA